MDWFWTIKNKISKSFSIFSKTLKTLPSASHQWDTSVYISHINGYIGRIGCIQCYLFTGDLVSSLYPSPLFSFQTIQIMTIMIHHHHHHHHSGDKMDGFHARNGIVQFVTPVNAAVCPFHHQFTWIYT